MTNNKETGKLIEEKLYHFTSRIHIEKILESGYLKLTPSYLIEPKDAKVIEVEKGWYKIVSEMSDGVKPVVWLTDSEIPEGLAIEVPEGAYDKNRIRITIPKKPEYKWWLTWAERNKMNKKWLKRFTNGLKYGSWYISEEPIKLDDISLIEDLHTGETLYKK